jgi:hypothetical protein
MKQAPRQTESVEEGRRPRWDGGLRERDERVSFSNVTPAAGSRRPCLR